MGEGHVKGSEGTGFRCRKWEAYSDHRGELGGIKHTLHI